jgi:hypothetical protein
MATPSRLDHHSSLGALPISLTSLALLFRLLEELLAACKQWHHSVQAGMGPCSGGDPAAY